MLTFMWFSLSITIATASLLFTSAFFNWPIPLKRLITGDKADSVSSVTLIDEEINYRLRDIPNTLKRSRASKNPVEKGNLLSFVFGIPEANWPTPLFPEFADRSVISLCSDLIRISNGAEAESSQAASRALQQWARAAREKYYVHDMYKMSLDQLTAAENEAEDYYMRAVLARPSWAVQ